MTGDAERKQRKKALVAFLFMCNFSKMFSCDGQSLLCDLQSVLSCTVWIAARAMWTHTGLSASKLNEHTSTRNGNTLIHTHKHTKTHKDKCHVCYVLSSHPLSLSLFVRLKTCKSHQSFFLSSEKTRSMRHVGICLSPPA